MYPEQANSIIGEAKVEAEKEKVENGKGNSLQFRKLSRRTAVSLTTSLKVYHATKLQEQAPSSLSSSFRIYKRSNTLHVFALPPPSSPSPPRSPRASPDAPPAHPLSPSADASSTSYRDSDQISSPNLSQPFLRSPPLRRCNSPPHSSNPLQCSPFCSSRVSIELPPDTPPPNISPPDYPEAAIISPSAFSLPPLSSLPQLPSLPKRKSTPKEQEKENNNQENVDKVDITEPRESAPIADPTISIGPPTINEPTSTSETPVPPTIPNNMLQSQCTPFRDTKPCIGSRALFSTSVASPSGPDSLPASLVSDSRNLRVPHPPQPFINFPAKQKSEPNRRDCDQKHTAAMLAPTTGSATSTKGNVPLTPTVNQFQGSFKSTQLQPKLQQQMRSQGDFSKKAVGVVTKTRLNKVRRRSHHSYLPVGLNNRRITGSLASRCPFLFAAYSLIGF